jgi:hypothetical protein
LTRWKFVALTKQVLLVIVLLPYLVSDFHDGI